MSVEGFLLKKGDKGFNPGWKRRWFQLQGTKIYYKVNDKETKSIDLDKGSEVATSPDEDPSKRNCFFKITNKNKKRVYFLQADTQQERDYWIQEIQKAIDGSDDPKKPIERKSSRLSVTGLANKVSSLRLKGASTTQKIIQSTNADPAKLEKLNALHEDVDSLFKRDMVELTRALKKYQEVSEQLTEVGARVAEELVRIGNKYSETPYGSSMNEFSTDFKQLEEERRKLVSNGVKKVADLPVQMENDLKNWEETKKKMKDLNKKLDEHVKAQVDQSATLSGNNSAIQAMTEIYNMCSEIDGVRDQMISQTIYHRNYVLHRCVGSWVDFLIQQKAFSNIQKGYLDNSIQKGTSALEESPKKPETKWESYQPPSLTIDTSSSTSSPPQQQQQQQPPQQSQQQSTSASQTPALPPGWEAAQTEDGYTYYYNSATQQSSWEIPTS